MVIKYALFLTIRGMDMGSTIDERIKAIDEKVERMMADKKRTGEDVPHYMIKSDKIFVNENDSDGKVGAECLWVDSGSERHSTHDASGEHIGDGKVIGNDVVVCMKYGAWGPLLQECMLAGTVLKEIHINRMISQHGKQTTVQELTYENCMVKAYHQSGDRVLFAFGYSAVEDLKIKYDSKGVKTGQIGMKFDFGKVHVEAGS